MLFLASALPKKEEGKNSGRHLKRAFFLNFNYRLLVRQISLQEL